MAEAKVYGETEHQELFYPQSDLRRATRVHIPSALGKLGYFVFLRLDAKFAAKLAVVKTHLVVGGLRPDDVHLAYGEGFTGPAKFPSSAPGKAWVCLCRANVSRGDGELTFTDLPSGLAKADILLCTWLRFVQSGQGDDWLAGQQDPHWAPSGVPLGGIGCGKIEICRDGRFRNFSGNNNQDMPFEEPDGLAGAFLSVALAGQERLLSTRSIQTPEGEIAPCKKLEVLLAFPQAKLQAAEVFPGVDAQATLSGMIVPHDLKLSSLPGFLVRWQITNRTSKAVKVSCRLAWPNLVGQGGGIGSVESRTGYADGFYRFWQAPDAPQAAPLAGRNFQALQYSNAPSEVSPAADGAHYISARFTPGTGVAGVSPASGVSGMGGPPMRPRGVSPLESPAGVSPEFGTGVALCGDPLRGSVVQELDIAPGATATADMAVIWEMPHWIDTLNVDRGHWWQTTCATGKDILELVYDNFDAILSGAGQLYSMLAATDLSDWLRLRLANCCYPLVTNSVFYRDGRFSINEGPTEMAGCYGTIDQRLAAHPATLLLFPQLNLAELGQFTRVQGDNGDINHDLGSGHLEAPSRAQSWPDIACSFAIQWAIHCWSTGSEDVDASVYNNVKKALLRHGVWADAGGGVAQLGAADKLGTSYDGYHYIGTMAYVGTLWIAALEVARLWASRRNDGEFAAKAQTWIDAAKTKLDRDLWNGRFYRAYAGQGSAVNENCHAGTLAGQYYSRMLTGRDVLAPDRLDACAAALVKLNGNGKFQIPPDEVAPDLATFTEYGWLPYVESFCLAPLASLGKQEFWPVWRKVVQSMQQDGKTPCDTRLMYQPVSGAQSWGSYYMTAPASWLVYQAALDFFYDPTRQTLRLSPSLQGSFAVVHPLFWAIGRRDGASISLTVQKVFASHELKVSCLEVPDTARRVTLAAKELAQSRPAGRYLQFAISPKTLAVGATIDWTVE